MRRGSGGAVMGDSVLFGAAGTISLPLADCTVQGKPMDRSDLPPAAQRALAEAEARRKAAEAAPTPPRELGGRDGPEPVRYGDWEKKGIAVDF